MSAVYIVFREDESRTVMGVFSSLLKARAYAASLPPAVLRECIIQEVAADQPVSHKKYHGVDLPPNAQ